MLNGSRTTLRAGIIALLVVAAIPPALGCAGGSDSGGRTETAAGPRGSTTALASQGLPEGLQAVMGRTETEPATLTNSVWCVTRAGVALAELPRDYALAVGERGATVAYSDLETGRLFLWHPAVSATESVTEIAVPAEGRSLGDLMALSPDESKLVLIRSQSPEGGTEDSGTDQIAVAGYLVDVPSGQVTEWDWLDTVSGGEVVTAVRWYKTSDSIYLSVGPGGGSQGEKSYVYELSTGRSHRITGLAAVLDAGLEGQVVGLGAATSPDEFDYPAGSANGAYPLVLWQDGQLLRLPRDPRLTAWDFAWLSDDGRTIVVRGAATGAGGPVPCLEVLELGDAGWSVSRLFDGGDSLTVVYGVAFEPNSHTFYFQGGTSPATPGGAVNSSRLFALDTDTGQASACIELPGGEGANFVQTLGIAGAQPRGGTGCVEGSCPTG